MPEPSPAPRSTLTWKDWLTVTISILALTISAVGSYFTFFRETTALNAVIVGVDLGGRVTTLDVAVMNTGNRQVALTYAEIYLVQLNNNEKLGQSLNPDTTVADKEVLPILIEPGKMALFQIKAESNWDAVQAYRQEIEPGDDHTHITIMGIRLLALGATGVHLNGKLDAIEIQFQDTKFVGYTNFNSSISLKPYQPL